MTSTLEPGIFRHPRFKKNLLPPLIKKRKNRHQIEEISFDPISRAEYLTGFHKRKVARVKAAQAEAEKKAAEERRFLRKKVRDERKQELEKHVEAVNALLKNLDDDLRDYHDEKEKEDWEGFDEDENSLVTIPNSHEEEYTDEGKYTTVTVETINVSKDGLFRSDGLEEESKSLNGLLNCAPTVNATIEDCRDDQKKIWPKKSKKKKFRYESKLERKLVRTKQKSEKRKKGVARRNKASK